MRTLGGSLQRLTYFGASCIVIGWTPGSEVVFRTDAGVPFPIIAPPRTVSLHDATIRIMPTGPAEFISFGAKGGLVIARPAVDPARWKRYRGGAGGNFWIDRQGRGRFRPFSLDGNPSRPLWIDDRIFFVSDHEGVGNLYSCSLDGSALRGHTHHRDFCVRNAAYHGTRIVYQCGADLFILETATDKVHRVPVDYHTSRPRTRTRPIDASKYVETCVPSPGGDAVITVVRGRAFAMRTKYGAVREFSAKPRGRLGSPVWLRDRRFAIVSDCSGEEAIELRDWAAKDRVSHLRIPSLGRITGLSASRGSDHLAITNHRHELILVDLVQKRTRVIDRPRSGPVQGFDFSPDGRWVAYGCPVSPYTSIIKLCRALDGAVFPITRPVLRDVFPSFDPGGRFLYFLSYRVFDPVLDNIQSGVSFPCGMRPYLISLQREFSSPFDDAEVSPSGRARETRVDLRGIEDRVIAFPIPESIYLQISAVRDGLIMLSKPPQGSLTHKWIPQHDKVNNATLSLYSFSTRRLRTLAAPIRDYAISLDLTALVYRTGDGRLAMLTEAEWSPRGTAKDHPPSPSTWIDLGRIRATVDPRAEWSQIYRESWRLQRDHFLPRDTGWPKRWLTQYDKYLPLLERINSRAELSDLLYELLGELSTSHADVLGGDLRAGPPHNMGHLGADLKFDPIRGNWMIARVIRGDSWDEQTHSPLAKPGLNLAEDAVIIAVNGQRVNGRMPPGAFLANQAGVPVELTLTDAKRRRRVVEIVPLASERGLRYREWVEHTRSKVHKATRHRCGYLHIPNMASRGCSEFFRYYLAEVEYEALIIDLRFNEGGYLHEAILEKIMHRLGSMRFRWSGELPYPAFSVKSSVVILINEYCQSAGEVFAQSLRSLGFGPLIGTRTWGGITGFWPRQYLSDGGLTTQPELKTIFTTQQPSIENHGVEPDLQVHLTPEDYVLGRDPQLARAIRTIQEKLGVAHSFGPQAPSNAKHLHSEKRR